MEFRYYDGQETHTVRVTERPDGFQVCIGERCYEVQASEVGSTGLDLRIDGHFRRAQIAHTDADEERWVALEGEVYQATRVLHRRTRRTSVGGEETLAATMPGQIVAVLVASGDTVERGQPMVIMEAMKMELRVTAPQDGTVARVLVEEGEAVQRGQPLVEMART